MVKREAIRNLCPGNTLEIKCADAADLDSTYQTAMQVRREKGLTGEAMPITRSGPTCTVIIKSVRTSETESK